MGGFGEGGFAVEIGKEDLKRDLERGKPKKDLL